MLDKLKQAAELLESIYYDLEACENVSVYATRKISLAEDMVADVIQYIESKKR